MLMSSYAGFAFLSAGAIGLLSVSQKRGRALGGTVVQGIFVILGVRAGIYWMVYLLTKRGSGLFEGLAPSTVMILLGAGLITLGNNAFAFEAVQRVGASIHSAGRAVHPLFSLTMGMVLLGEFLTHAHVAAIFVMVGGLIVLSLSRGGDRGGWRWWELGFSIGTAFCIAAASVLARYVLTRTSASPLEVATLTQTGGVLLLSVPFLFMTSRFIDMSGEVLLFFGLAALFSSVSLLSMWTAVSLGPVAMVSALVSSAPLFALLFTHLFLHDLEQLSTGVVFGAVLIVCGACSLVLL